MHILAEHAPDSRQCHAGYNSFSKGDLDTAAMEAGAPEGFFCPISLKLFRDPVMLPTGQTCAPSSSLPTAPPGVDSLSAIPCVTALLDLLASRLLQYLPGEDRTARELVRKFVLCSYERRYIERWLAGGRNLCPSTGTVLTLPATLVPNVALRKSIEVWAEKHARWMLVRQPLTLQRHLHFACSQQQDLTQYSWATQPLTSYSGSRASDSALAHSLHGANAVSQGRYVCAVPHLCCACMQGQDGKVKAIPEDEDFARPGTAGQEAADLTLAVHLQQEELLTGNQFTPTPQDPRWATKMLPSPDTGNQILYTLCRALTYHLCTCAP